MALHNIIGRWGEDIAVEHLVAKGYSIIERDFKAGRFELDIVAMDGNVIVVVEVKTRTNPNDDPAEAIDEKKIRRLAKAMDAYLVMKRLRHYPRIDIIAISGKGPGHPYTLEHFIDAIDIPLNAL